MQQFFPANEQQRLKALRRYRILDTEPEARFDDVVTAAAERFGVPMALFSLVDEDRQWFKSVHGFAYAETERTGAFCSHTVDGVDGEGRPYRHFEIDAPLVVENARENLLFADSLLVKAPPHIVFYAGVPVRASTGEPLGALCILDTEPRSFEIGELRDLIALARRIESALELRQGELTRQ